MERVASDCLTIPAAAARLGVSRFTVRAWLYQGRLPYFKLGRRVVLSASDVDAFLLARRVVAHSVRRKIRPKKRWK